MNRAVQLYNMYRCVYVCARYACMQCNCYFSSAGICNRSRICRMHEKTFENCSSTRKYT